MTTEATTRTREDVDAAVLAYITEDAARNDGRSATGIREVGAATGIAPGTVQQAMRRLEAAGKLRQAGKDGRRNVWTVA